MSHDSNKEFDGIRQEDNPLPPWWKAIFILCVIFAVVYSVYFHKYSKWGTEDMYNAEVEEHEKLFPQAKELVSEDGSNPLRGDAASIEEGQKTFKNVCAACHRADAKGLVGPDLTDAQWLHGTTDAQIYKVIMKGVPVPETKTGKGAMPPHEKSLGSEKVYQVMAWLAKNNPSLKAK